MANIYCFLIFMIVLFSCQSQAKDKKNKSKNKGEVVEEYIPYVADYISELSGLLVYDGLYWGFNDSGGLNEIYGFNKKGNIKKVLKIKNAKNVDWESIAQDSKYIYVGDFGNNKGNRKDLCIYKIEKKKLSDDKVQKIQADKISISYSGQKVFKFEKKAAPFDCEAMVEYEKNLYIFSKNWRDRTTWLYRVPKDEGEYNIKRIDMFNVKGLITGADISPDKTKLALIGYQNYKPFVWLFYNFSESDFFNGQSKRIDLGSIEGAQTEGICFLKNNTILISCEKTEDFRQGVFVLKINNIR